MLQSYYCKYYFQFIMHNYSLVPLLKVINYFIRVCEKTSVRVIVWYVSQVYDSCHVNYRRRRKRDGTKMAGVTTTLFLTMCNY